LGAEWLLLFGLGKIANLAAATLAARIGHGIKTALSRKRPSIAIFSDAKAVPPGLTVLATHHAAYHFDAYKPKDDDNGKRQETVITIHDGRMALKEFNTIGEAISYAKNIANQPPNVITPAALAREAVELGRKFKLGVTVWDEARLRKEGFGGVLAVGDGSGNKPRFIRIDYKGGRKSAPPICVVGKAITFDSGGISIKPSDRMDEMKFDKCGGVAVLGIMRAVAALKLKHNIMGLISSAENLPSSTSYRPGDLVKNLSGKYIEVLNTDAEGRIVLSDALTYASRLKPRAIVDLATLTGACVVALGNEAAGLLGNSDRLIDQLRRAGERTGERAWPMPLYTEFCEKVKSDIGYVKNTAGREAGTSTAAAFLQAFVENGVPWAHLDIAGTAWTTKEEPHRAKGATGFGVALITEWLRTLR
jgi:leucyl aminopeptidase